MPRKTQDIQDVEAVEKAQHELSKEEVATRMALLEQAYHLPGNNYWQDFLQYMLNSNPLFNIFNCHPLHPITIPMRLVTCLGSVIFGLAITNIVYLAFVLDDQNFNETQYQKSLTDKNITNYDQINNQITQINVTNGMVALWTVGGALNALYDQFIWYVAACACCMGSSENSGSHRGQSDEEQHQKMLQRWKQWEKYRKYAPFLVMFVVVGVTALATLAVLVRATVDANNEDEQQAQTMQMPHTSNAESYRFLVAFFVEVAFSLLVWSPLLSILMFSGVLGLFCGHRILMFSGRPGEMKAEESSSRRVSVKSGSLERASTKSVDS